MNATMYAVRTNVNNVPVWIILHGEWAGSHETELDGWCLIANREAAERELHDRSGAGTIIAFSITEIQPIGEL